MVAAGVRQEPLPHDGVRERAAEICIKPESSSRPCPFQPQPQPQLPGHLRSGRPPKKLRVNSCISFSRAILLQLGLVVPAFFFSASVCAFDRCLRTRSVIAPRGKGPLGFRQGPLGPRPLPDKTCLSGTWRVSWLLPFLRTSFFFFP